MRVRLVRVTTKRGARAERVTELDLERLTIGRGTDSTVLVQGLDVSLRHATIGLRDGTPSVEPVGDSRVEVGRLASLRGQRLRPGDEIRIGAARLRVREPIAGEDLHLEVEEEERGGGEREALRARTHTRLADRTFPVRPLAWGGFLVVLAVFVAGPLVFGRFRESWSSGELASAHRFFGNDCARCHAVPFERVRNTECTSCHTQVGAHADSEALHAELVNVRCAECHADHRGSAGLAHSEQALCSDCHADLSARFGEVRVRDVADFGTAHPEFTLSHAAAGGEIVQSEWRPALREEPRLHFDHLRHVGQVVADRESGEKRNMPCGDCHQPDVAGRLMQPVRFEEHCAACHGMTFDERFEEREAVHGDLAKLHEDLVEFYADRALAGDPAAAPALRRARPGEPLSDEERAAALVWAREQAGAAARRLLEDEKACRTCHPVEADDASGFGHAIPEPRIPEQWLVQGGFVHGAHEVFECRRCHAGAAVFDPEAAPDLPRPDWSREGSRSPYVLSLLAEQPASEESHDVLIPGIDVCRECHGGPRAPEPAVASDCVLCHPFHRRELGPLEQAAR